ncbi:MAG: ATP-binding cassette domain-containing protein, partial [Candidatus Methanomethylicia archaeon]
VVENVMISLIHGRKHLGLSDARKEAVKFLELVGLNNERDRTVNNLSLAGRRLLEVARALALNPEVILLDEVIAGLNPSETVKVMDLIKSIRKDMGITIFWVEHVMRAIMNTAERIIVLDKGMVIAEGPPIEITNSTRVIEAYLGKKLGAENA